MTLPLPESKLDNLLFKTLNEDIKLKPDKYGVYDIEFVDGDLNNVTGLESLYNACVISIMTRYKELQDNKTYADFGCRVHELIKDNKSKMLLYKLEVYIEDVLKNMRRVKKVNEIIITETEPYTYNVHFNITSLTDETVRGDVLL